jgi:hypothetical protein
MLNFHSYDYRPEEWQFQHVKHSGEGIPMGMEIESEPKDEDSYSRDKLLTKLADVDLPIVAKHDGSLNEGGVEMVMHPMSLRFAHSNRIKWEEWSRAVTTGGYECDGHKKCGIHIHTPRNWWGKSQLYRLKYLMYNCDGLAEFFGNRPSAGGTSYSIDNASSIVESARSFREGRGRYMALNFGQGHRTSGQTLEFRIFQSATSVATIYQYYEFVDAIYEFTRNYNIASIRRSGNDTTENRAKMYGILFKRHIELHKHRYPNLAKKAKSWDTTSYKERIRPEYPYDYETNLIKGRYMDMVRALGIPQRGFIIRTDDKFVKITDREGKEFTVIKNDELLSAMEDSVMRESEREKKRLKAMRAAAREYKKLRESVPEFTPVSIDTQFRSGMIQYTTSPIGRNDWEVYSGPGVVSELLNDHRTIRAVRFTGQPSTILVREQETTCA